MRAKQLNLILILILSLFWLFPAVAATDLPVDIPEELLEDANRSYIFVFNDDLPAGKIRDHSIGLAK